eukprot:scaffold12.g8164.t1
MGPRPADNAQALRKQRAAIEAIAADNQKLKEELMLENKFSVNPTTATAAALIANLQQQADVYAKKITEEQRLKAELEQQIGRMEEKIARQRVAMGGINNSTEQAIKARWPCGGQGRVQRRIVILEDRVQQASVRYNDALTRSRALRVRVDSLRRERMLFEDLRRKMERGLARRRAEMADTIRAIGELHEAREKATILQGQVKAQADRDVASYEAEWRKLTEIIEADRRARDTARQREILEREEQMSALFKQEFSLGGRRRSSVVRAQAAARSDAAAPAPAEKVKQHSEAFERIKAATGAASMDELVEWVRAGEEASFGLFNYVNDLNNEVEKLEEHIGALRWEVERHRAEAAAKLDDGAARAVRDLDAALAATEAKAEAYEEKHAQATALVGALRGTVLDMFARTGCGTPAVMELLGGEGVTEANLMQYLGLLEQRTNELLERYAALAADGDASAAAERAVACLTSKRTGTAPPEYVIEPPSTTPGVGAGAGGGAEGGAALPSASADGGPEEDLPLDRAALEARVQRVVAAKVEHAVKIRAARPAAASGGGGGKL